MASAVTPSQRKLARRKDDVLVNEDLMDITIVLDRSGSMGGVKNDVIEGFNKFLRDQQEKDGEAVLTLIQFDDKHELNYEAKPIKECKFLTEGDYIPRGGTHLFDAVARAIAGVDERLKKATDETRAGKVVLTIFTDGGDTNSPEVTREQFHEMLKSRRENQQWTIALVGCDEATLQNAGSLGLHSANAVGFNKANRGTKAAFANVSKGVSNLRSMSYEGYTSGTLGPSGPEGSPGPAGPAGFENFALLAELTPEEDSAARL